MFSRLNQLVVSTITCLPASSSRKAFLIRGYNKVLGLAKNAYLGKTFFGARLHCDPKDAIQSRILHFGVWEPNISNYISRTLRSGATFVDVGANIGYDTLLAAHCVGPAGTVVAIEASPLIFQELTANLSLNPQYKNIRTVACAAARDFGTVDVFDPCPGNKGRTTTNPTVPTSTKIATVSARPLTDILSPAECRNTQIIKIDVEGAELPILEDVLANLQLFPVDLKVIVEAALDRQRDGWQRVVHRFQSTGFNVFHIANDYGWHAYMCPPGYQPPTFVAELPYRQADLIFARAGSA